MNELEKLKQSNKLLQAERLAMRGLLEKQGVTVNMGVIQQVGERISNLMKLDSAGDYTVAVDRDLASLVTTLIASIDPKVKPKADIVTPTTKQQYDALSREQRTQLVRNLGQTEFGKLLSKLNK